ncbi:MAG: restriction endonuclease subunit S [Planctomycetes bacterium]|nr:restriction endonuclease subunit S [Planctomycetota bacterium]
MSGPKRGERAGALRRYRPYPAYKDSGVEWLGEIPAHWDVKRLRFVSESNPVPSEVRGLPGDTEVSFVPMEAVGEHGGLSLEVTKQLADVKAGYTYFRDGDIVIAKITPCFENGKGALASGLTNGIAFGTTELHVLRALDRADRRFMFYVTLSDAFRRLGEADMYGAGGQKRVSESFVRNFSPALPSVPEQRAIAAFLDRETARIDALVAKKERLIELLQEQRTALITRAVTKGLDPTVPMKDSGVEWLGEIPAHWEVKRLAWLTDCLDGRRVPLNSEERGTMQGDYPYWGANSIVDYIDRWLFDEELVLLGEDGAPFFDRTKPVAFRVTGKIWVNNHAHVLRPRRDVVATFLAHALNCVDYRAFIDGTTRDKLTQGDMNAISIQCPPPEEQRAIAAFLDRETARIDALFAKVRDAIDRLKELRTALISAAVTGKIDVREEVA